MLSHARAIFWQAISTACLLLLVQVPLQAQVVNPGQPMVNSEQPQAAVAQGQPVPLLTADQLEDLVAPIALYPDPLLSQVLVASTYPVQLIEAYQWLQRTPMKGEALVQAAAAENWDPSVQALVVFPNVLKQLNADIRWTETLGNAFSAQQADVMNAIQQMRFEAEQAEKLTSTPEQRVTTTYVNGQPVVTIVPANPDVIYVPTYNPYLIWGEPLYYPYAAWYYPTNFFGFGAGITIGAFFGPGWHGWGGWGWYPSWHSHSVVVNRAFVRNYHFNEHGGRYGAGSYPRGGSYAGRGGYYNRRNVYPGGNVYRRGLPPGTRAKPGGVPGRAPGGVRRSPGVRGGQYGLPPGVRAKPGGVPGRAPGGVRGNPGIPGRPGRSAAPPARGAPSGGGSRGGGGGHGGGGHGGGGHGGGGHGGGGHGGGGHGGGGHGGGGHGGGGHGGGHR